MCIFMDVLYIIENQIHAMICNTHISHTHKFLPVAQSQLGVAANKFMPKFKLEGFHNHWIIFLWILHSPSLITIILFSWKFIFFVTNRDKLNFEHWIQKWFKHFSQIVNNSKTFLKTSHTHSLSFYFLIF